MCVIEIVCASFTLLCDETTALKCLLLHIPTGPLPDSILTSATASLDAQTSTPSTQEDTAALLDSMALAVLALQVCRDVETLPLLQL
jgi:hypothetical protein